MPIQILRVILDLVPDARFHVLGWTDGEFPIKDQYSYENNLVWDDTRQKPSWEAIQQRWIEIRYVERCRDIEEIRDTKISEGAPYLFPDGIYGTIQMRDIIDQRNIQANASAAQALLLMGQTEEQMKFRDMQNYTHTMYPSQMLHMALTAMSYGQQMYEVSWYHKDNLLSIKNQTGKSLSQIIEELEAYDITVGWS